MNKPFLKWVGGKSRIVEQIVAHLPKGERLIEPFVGSGAVFLNTDYPKYLLADANKDLINMYLYLRDWEDFISYSKYGYGGENNNQSAYDRLREKFNSDVGMARSALFIYLNRHGYAGLCRYNSKGEFNVPFGNYKHPKFPSNEIKFFADKAVGAKFFCQDFTDTFRSVGAGDVVYCDPPYIPLSKTAKFSAYTANGFGLDRHIELARLAKDSQAMGATVVISNHDTEDARGLYNGAEIVEIDVQRTIGKNKAVVGEILAIFRGGSEI